MLTSSIAKIFFLICAILIALGIFGLGYIYGKKSISKDLTTKITTEQAIDAILLKQNTWQSQFYPSSKQSHPGRTGAWVSIFKLRSTGAVPYVVFHNRTNNKIFLLQTFQERIINGKTIIVSEPPGGYFNGTYISSVPHQVAEYAEHEIEINWQKNHPIPADQAYFNGVENFEEGKLQDEKYVEDANLWETAYREVAEETGLDLNKIENDPNYIFKRVLYSESESPDQYVSIRLIEITGSKLPALGKITAKEIRAAEWIPLENFDLENKKVITSSGIIEIKTYVNFTESIVNELLNTYTLNKK